MEVLINFINTTVECGRLIGQAEQLEDNLYKLWLDSDIQCGRMNRKINDYRVDLEDYIDTLKGMDADTLEKNYQENISHLKKLMVKLEKRIDKVKDYLEDPYNSDIE